MTKCSVFPTPALKINKMINTILLNEQKGCNKIIEKSENAHFVNLSFSIFEKRTYFTFVNFNFSN